MSRKRTRVEARSASGALVLMLPDELREEIEEQLTEIVGLVAAQVIVLDFTDTRFADSAGAGAIIDLLRTSHAHGARMLVAGLVEQPLLLFRRIGLLERIAAFPTVEDALNSKPDS